MADVAHDLSHPAVAKQLNSDGFLIATYVTDAIKEGSQIWPK